MVLLAALLCNYGRGKCLIDIGTEGTRQMIELLKLSPKQGQDRLQQAIESALTGSCYDGAAVHQLLNARPGHERHRNVPAKPD